MRRNLRHFLVAAFASVALANSYAASYPSYASLPKLPIDKNSVEVDERGESEFVTRDKPETRRGRVYLGYLDYSKWGENKQDALAGIVNEMEKGGWEVMFRDEPAKPPLATLKRANEKDNSKDIWATVEVFDRKARVLVLEPTGPQ